MNYSRATRARTLEDGVAEGLTAKIAYPKAIFIAAAFSQEGVCPKLCPYCRNGLGPGGIRFERFPHQITQLGALF